MSKPSRKPNPNLPSGLKQYRVISRYYENKEVRMYEPGEIITVPAATKKSKAWAELSEPVPEVVAGVPGYGPALTGAEDVSTLSEAQSIGKVGGRASDSSPV